MITETLDSKMNNAITGTEKETSYFMGLSSKDLGMFNSDSAHGLLELSIAGGSLKIMTLLV